MKKVPSLKNFLSSKKGDLDGFKDEKYGTSILGNIRHPEFNLSRGLTNITGFLSKGVKNKGKQILSEDEQGDFDRTGGMGRSYLAPPQPPSFSSNRLRRVNSSTLSLNRTKKKNLTVEELYVEVAYTILHMIGCDSDQVSKTELLNHIKDAFQLDENRHQQLLDIATMKEEPYLKLNLEIHSAKSLRGKDISGYSDPFCTFYLTSNPYARNNTSYKPRTLNPTWNEEYVLDVNSTEQDQLRVDVWDFNPEENMAVKLKKINEVKDARGVRKFIKETLGATTGTLTHELLGSTQIPLKDIPAKGVSGWWPLEKPDTKKSKERGEVKLTLTLSTEKDGNLSSQEHRHLLKILFAHELQKTSAAPFTWNGEFSRESVIILSQHAVQGKLTGADTVLARWLVYCHTHCDLPLDYRVFLPILEKLKYTVDNSLLSAEEETKFVEVGLIFSQHCIEFIRKHRQFLASDIEYMVQIESILKCLQHVQYCTDKINGTNSTQSEEELCSQIEGAAKSSIEDWYHYVLDKMPIENNKLMRVKNLTNLANILGQDLGEGSAATHKLFKDALDMDYKKICYTIFSTQFKEISEKFVFETCEQLNSVIYTEISEKDDYVSNSIGIGTALFELYLALQSIVRHGQTILTEYEFERSCLYSYHVWFNKAVPRWLDIALYKAMQRIVKAVELDDLSPVDEFVKHSSSAVDIKTVLMQIKTFWVQLNWPDVEASYTFISKILDDVCKTTIYFSDKMVERVNRGHNNNAEFQINKSLCLAINNIDYVLQYIQPFVGDLGYDTTLAGLEALNGDMVAASCRRTLKTLVQNAMENVENKILEILEDVGEKMAPVISDFLNKCACRITYTGKDCEDTLLKYLDENLILLKENLTDRNFERILSVIWECSAQSLENTIYHCIEARKPPSYFRTLCDILKILENFFYGDRAPQDEMLEKMRGMLQLYASSTADLIAKYYGTRLQYQRSLQVDDYAHGRVALKVQLLNQHLRVEILNASELRPPEIHRGSIGASRMNKKLRARSNMNMSRSQRQLDWVKSKFSSLKVQVQSAQVQLHTAQTQNQADPYISLRLVPESKFTDVPKLRTRTLRGTLFPLYDEKFDLVLQNASERCNDAYLQILVKDRGLMGQGFFLGEAFLPLQELQGNKEVELSKLPQLHIPLTRPNDTDSDLVLALDSRIQDRQAREFLKRERRKM